MWPRTPKSVGSMMKGEKLMLRRAEPSRLGGAGRRHRPQLLGELVRTVWEGREGSRGAQVATTSP